MLLYDAPGPVLSWFQTDDDGITGRPCTCAWCVGAALATARETPPNAAISTPGLEPPLIS